MVELRKIHGGALEVEAPMPVECNAYCRNGEHCDLEYAEAWAPAFLVEETFREQIEEAGAIFIRIEPAREAPPPERGRFLTLDREDPPAGVQFSPWLVFWRKP